MNTSLRPKADDGESSRGSQLTMVPPPPRRRRRERRVILAFLFLLILVWFVPSIVNLAWIGFRPGKMEQWMSRAVGRPVKLNDVHFTVLPEPGFTAGSDGVTGLVIADDPAFGAEPVLLAQQATATLRLSSLWRGRIEIASLSLKNASLNLVRANDGHWNVERLLLRASEVATAPTSKKLAESARMRFPYIEVSEARVNLKLGNEKTPYALTGTEFALWLPAENRWNLRLEGIPTRTDLRMTDTGKLRLSGSFDRATRLEELPFHLNVSYEKAQLGQLTALFYGRDRGWRGILELNGEISGTLGEFKGTTQTSLTDFHRYDIVRSGEVNLSAKCAWTAQPGRVLGGDCSIPVSSGRVLVSRQAGANTDTTMVLEQVPAAAVARILSRTKAGLPDDLSADGVLLGNLSRTGGSWTGAIVAQSLTVKTSVLDPALRVGELRLEADATPSRNPASGESVATNTQSLVPPLRVAPVRLDLDGAQPVVLSGKLDSEGYDFLLAGTADLSRLLQTARLAGLRPPAGAVAGVVSNLQAHYSGVWAGFSAPVIRSSAVLNSATLPIRGIAEPLSVTTATVEINQQHTTVSQAHVSFPKSGVALNGEVAFDRQCATGSACNLKFRVLSEQLSTEQLRRLLLPARSGPFGLFSSGSRADLGWLLQAGGEGQITVRALNLHNMELTDARGKISFSPGKAVLNDLQGTAFSGSIRTYATVDLSGAEPAYRVSGTIDRGNIEQLAAAFGDRWASGTLHLDFQLRMAGDSPEELRRSAAGSGSFVLRNGSLAPAGIQPVPFRSWNGGLAVRSSGIVFTTNSMDGLPGVNAVTGSVGFDHQADLLIHRGTAVIPVQGSLRAPEPITVTQASK